MSNTNDDSPQYSNYLVGTSKQINESKSSVKLKQFKNQSHKIYVYDKGKSIEDEAILSPQ